MQITGLTRILFILCDPVHHVPGTHLFNEQLEREGIDAAFSPLHVLPADLPEVVDALRKMQNVAGFGVTIPHKIDVMPLLDGVTESARQVGSVNFVHRAADGTLTGTNIDGDGFLRGLESRGMSVAGRKVLQIGAGGAGRAVAFATALAGAARLSVWNRTPERAARLVEDIRRAAPPGEVTQAEDPSPAGYDLVINTTPVGMVGFPEDLIDYSELGAGTGMGTDGMGDSGPDVAEIIITPEETPLVRAARERGLRSSIGRDMLIGQYEHMRDFIGLAGGDNQ